MFARIRVHGNASSEEKRKPLEPKHLPLLGPRFVPPSFMHLQSRNLQAVQNPSSAYLKPLYLVHPLWHPELRQCPHCGEKKHVSWDSWNAKGHHEVHGLRFNEYALGYQLRCETCKKANAGKANRRGRQPTNGRREDLDIEESSGHCFTTTSSMFWKDCEFWTIPSEHSIFSC